METYTLNINGKSHSVNVRPDTPLLWVLRDHCELVGTKYGCGIAQCGACTVHIDGEALRSCSLTVDTVQGKKITTIEGLSKNGDHPLQKAWLDVDVSQCGYCQSGQIMTAASLLKENSNPTIEEIENHMQGNICRCGSYNRIREAILQASKNS